MTLRDARALVNAFHSAGVAYVFGLPGSQNVELFEALRASPLETVVSCNEMGAAFMANGYNRASGRVAGVATIPGPGITWAMTGITEAWLDSAALIHVTRQRKVAPGAAYQLQSIDQEAMLRPVTKAVLGADGATPDQIAYVAAQLAQSGEPGPVTVQIDAPSSTADYPEPIPLDDGKVSEIRALLAGSKRVVVMAGQGAAGASEAVTQLVELLEAAAVSTTSGRGVVPEDHPRSLGYEMAGTEAGPLNDLISSADLVLALGCKFSHNGSRGFGLVIPPEKLIHIDASAPVIGANYPARIGLVARCEEAVPSLLAQLEPKSGWAADELEAWRSRGRAASWPDEPEPVLAGRVSAADLLSGLRATLPRDAIVVTDSGRHQMLVRRWFPVLAERGLIVPSNLQSMGFAIPAAIGARLAAPQRRVVAVLGDGSLLMSGFELLTAKKLAIDLTVIVINDGAYGLIKAEQFADYGVSSGTELATPHLGSLADALGINFVRIERGDPAGQFAAALALRGVTLVEVPAREARAMHLARAKARLRRLLRRGR